MSTLWCSSHKIFKNLFCAWECDVKAKCPLKWIEWMFSVLKKIKLKAHFQPWCNARQFLITWNSQITENPSKIVFLKSHPGHIVNCFTVNTFAVRHFTVSLQYFEFCPEESEENFFKCHAWISSYSVNRVGEKDNVQIFSLSRSAWGF